MKNFEHFRNSEKAYSFHYLAQTAGATEYKQWESHGIVGPAIEHCAARAIHELNTQEFSLLVNA
jgi:hypothetical protein